MKLAVDIGSNTIKCLLGEFRNGNMEVFYEKSLESRISSGNGLVENAADLISEALLYFIEQSSAISADFSVEAVATSALRDAPNSAEICEKVFAKTSVKIKILTGMEEAELSYRGAMSDLAVDANSSNIFFDLGGGSMEVVRGNGGKVISSESFPIGAVRMTKRFLSCGVNRKGLSEIKNLALAEFEKKLEVPNFESLVGAGGAVAAARIMKRSMDFSTPENILSASEFKYMLGLISGLSAGGIASKFGISENRAEIIPAAFVCVLALMEFLGRDSLIHTFRNLRYGLIVSDSRV